METPTNARTRDRFISPPHRRPPVPEQKVSPNHRHAKPHPSGTVPRESRSRPCSLGRPWGTAVPPHECCDRPSPHVCGHPATHVLVLTRSSSSTSTRSGHCCPAAYAVLSPKTSSVQAHLIPPGSRRAVGSCSEVKAGTSRVHDHEEELSCRASPPTSRTRSSTRRSRTRA